MAISAAWKANERALAKRFKGRRAGPTGRSGPDVIHPLFSVETKLRKSLPAYLYDAMSQSCGAAQPGQLPIVVFHELGRRHDDDLVVIRLCDFEAWAGRLPLRAEEEVVG